MQTVTIAHIPNATLPLPSVDLIRAARRSDGLPAGWTDADIERAFLRYRRFLALVAVSPDTPIAPTQDIDVMWHLHMQSPLAYQRDCQRLFGGVLDHDGGFGKGEGELERLMACFEQTATRWQIAFGEPYAERSDATNCWHDCVGRCWHACSSKTGAC